MKQNTITRAMTRCGSARILIINSKEMVNDAIEIHGLSPTCAAALGRTLTAASLIGVMLKNKTDSATLTFDGDGVCGKLIATSDYYGNVKGCAENPTADLPVNAKGKLDVAGAVGKGNMYIIRDCGEGEPYVGMIPIVSGEIAEDITEYYARSEQIPTVCALGVLIGTDYKCIGAGGVMIQLLPGAEDEFIDRLMERVPCLSNVSHMFSEGKSNTELLSEIMGDIEIDIFDEIDCSYHCDCTEERVERALISLGKGELESIINEAKPIEVGCQFCGKKYVFDTGHMKKLYENAK